MKRDSAKKRHVLKGAKPRRRAQRTGPRPAPPRLPADLSHLPILGTEAARSAPLPQSGALAFRRLENGEMAVLLVRKRHSKNWGIPKGNAEPHLGLAENAAKEAFEEAGVTGRIEPRAAGTYRAVKRIYGLKVVIEVAVYLLEVFETAESWPEQSEREFKWCSPREAALLVQEPLLAELCGRLIRPEIV